MSESNVMRGDAGGVVEPPAMKVKDIRDKYKIRDYNDYAKPKSIGSKKLMSNETTAKNTIISSNNQSELRPDDVKASDHEVAQQVMGLFKGALDLQNNLEALEQDKIAENNFKESSSNKSSEKNSNVALPSNDVIDAKPKVNGASNNASGNSSSTAETKSDESSTNTPEVAAGSAESFDESLDQFYDVLNNLST